MFSSFDEAEKFLRDTIDRTETKRLYWVGNGSCGFMEKKSQNAPAFLLFAEEPLRLVMRDLHDDFDVVIDSRAHPDHHISLQELYSAIIRQLGLLF